MSSTLYESLADRVVHLIDHGTFKPGDRLPSVRKLSDEMKVSISTVIGAYGLLEGQGRIEARPQSGYYVRAMPAAPPSSEMRQSKPPARPASVGVDDLVMRILQD